MTAVTLLANQNLFLLFQSQTSSAIVTVTSTNRTTPGLIADLVLARMAWRGVCQGYTGSAA
jgi:hypothetical protein